MCLHGVTMYALLLNMFVAEEDAFQSPPLFSAALGATSTWRICMQIAQSKSLVPSLEAPLAEAEEELSAIVNPMGMLDPASESSSRRIGW